MKGGSLPLDGEEERVALGLGSADYFAAAYAVSYKHGHKFIVLKIS